ncbi:sugar transferase [Nocardia sp. NBC_01503]|uniref:sugar transferase n=1 Tax=Nocardia sp. NBC_01503 TaxID=2975997 RepID=UPI002E7B7E74|nr:sugar transferase [Nocardia sp. NBC_01503]WTL31818.1 sugar transferase [Nocardia sp. NBC_01503]
MAFQLDGEQTLDRSVHHPPPRPLPSGKRRWQAEYGRRLRITDTLVVCGSVALAQLIRFGGLNYDSPLDWAGDARIGYSVISVLLALVWLAFLAVGNTWSPPVIGTGPEEYRLIIAATMRLFGLIAIISLLLRMDFARGYLGIALPVGLIGLILNRMAWRKYAARRRRSGDYLTSVLVVGRRDSAREIMRCFERDAAVGYSVAGVYIPYPEDDVTVIAEADLPILQESSVLEAVRAVAADTVAIAATEHLGTQGINDLAWKLAPLGIDLVVTPGVVDVADQRLSIRPVANLPLLHIEKPQYDRAKSFGKAAFDFFFAALALLMISPMMIAIALTVKITSPGPVFYRSERIGLNGEPFRMIKFRSMCEDADKELTNLQAENEGAGLLFKMRADPRVTPIGRILRKFSLDELPQFINVLKGEMSVVGPRPPMRSEVERYDGKVRRRLLVKPGVTGLWQVSGRSDLSWEESVRLDLSYVENWSMVQDLMIIKRTIFAVARSDGAY